MKPRSAAIAAMLVTSFWLVPASGAATTTVVKRCAEGRPTRYAVKPFDGEFLSRYLSCVMAADGLRAHARDTISLYSKGGLSTVAVSFPKYMAPTVARFAQAPRSDNNWDYVNKRIEDAYSRTVAQPIPGFYTVYGDTAPPAPTLAQLARAFAPALTTINAGASGRRRPLVIDVVIQKGVWFHDGHGANLRYMVLIKAV